MKTLVITREESTDLGTFSKGVLDGDLEWDFLELPWRDNLPTISCVPPGSYLATLFHSQHFGRTVYQVHDVPGRDAIEIHPANWAGDRALGYHSDLRGCAAPGTARGELVTPKGTLQAGVLHSGLALDQLIEAAGERLMVSFAWREA